MALQRALADFLRYTFDTFDIPGPHPQLPFATQKHRSFPMEEYRGKSTESDAVSQAENEPGPSAEQPTILTTTLPNTVLLSFLSVAALAANRENQKDL